MNFIKQLEENSIQFSNNNAISDGKHSYTYASLWLLSGKIYRELKSRGIGKEDMVMVNLPRCAEVIIACVGIWRAGAAYVIFEDSKITKRRDFIYEDCGCKLRIDDALYQSMIEGESLDGYETVDDHDLAYACYTSGTTGNPKGAMHEFGAIEQCRYSYFYEGKYEMLSSDKYAMLSPLNFVAVIIVFPSLLYVGGELVIVPLSIVKNVESLKNFFSEQHITVTFVTPTFTEVFHEFNEDLRLLYLASEPAKHIYFDNLELYNVHAQSETGFLTTTFCIDKAYDMTPIGRTFIPDLDLKLLKEDGTVADVGETGEMCFKNIYFRGYIHHEEMTKEVFRGGIYHTGDMGRMLPDGNIVIVGRADDMVKINGNRVEPAEIEIALCDVMGTDWVGVKAVSHLNSIYIAAYYLDNPKRTLDEVKLDLSQRLPYYMLPSYYVKIDSIPVNANGKFSRKDLPEPDFDKVTAYAAPTDELEKLLAQVFGKVLGKPAIGIDDDFYERGGDSLKCIEIVSELDLPHLSASVIFKERTIRKIAQRLQSETSEEEQIKKTELNNIAEIGDKLEQSCKLSPFQKFFMDKQLLATKNNSLCIYNLPVLMRYGREIGTEKLRDAVQMAIASHPILYSKIYYDENNILCQKIDDSLLENIEIEEISENDFSRIKDELVQPFELIGKKLYRARIFQTEKNVYLFIDVHHIIADGQSMHILFEDIYKAYNIDDYRYYNYVGNDAYFSYLKHIERHQTGKHYKECQNYYESLYEGIDWSHIPRPDHEAECFHLGSFLSELFFDEKNYELLQRKFFVNHNAIYLTATLLAMAKYNNESKVMATWTYHGRDSKRKVAMVGVFIKDLPVALSLEKGMTLSDIFKSVNEQIQGGIAHSDYPYTFMCGPSYANDSTCFLCQMNVYDFESEDTLNGEQTNLVFREKTAADNMFNIQVLRENTGYVLEIDYVKESYEKDSISRFAEIYQKVVSYIFSQENHLMEYVLNEENVML